MEWGLKRILLGGNEHSWDIVYGLDKQCIDIKFPPLEVMGVFYSLRFCVPCSPPVHIVKPNP